MGISSADRGISTVLNLFSILSLPLAPDELDRDMSKINRFLKVYLKIFFY